MADHRLELSGTLLEAIIFGMEDQGAESWLDVEKQAVLSTRQPLPGDFDLGLESGRYLPLPPWSPQEGFQLRRGFTDTLTPGELKSDLDRLLHQGQGVFRAFKERLSREPGATSRWTAYKKEHFLRVISLWAQEYGTHIKLGSLPEESVPEDLLLEDFSFSHLQSEQTWEVFQTLATEAADEWASRFPGFGPWWTCQTRGLDALGQRLILVVAEDPQGGWASLGLGGLWDHPRQRIAEVLFWYTRPELRRLGLGTAVLEHLREALGRFHPRGVVIRPPETDSSLGRRLEHLGFGPCGSFFLLPGEKC